MKYYLKNILGDKELIIICSCLLSILIYQIFYCLTYFFFNLNIINQQLIENLTIREIKLFKQDSKDQFFYFSFFSINFITSFYFINYFNKKNIFYFRKYFKYLFIIFFFYCLLIILFHPKTFYFYFKTSFLSIFTLCFLSFFFIFIDKFKKKKLINFFLKELLAQKKLRLLCVFSVVTIFVILFLMNIFSISAFQFNESQFFWHFDPVYYSIVQVFNNEAILVNEFKNQYGLYPHFLLPIFKLFGLNLFNFSLTMSVILCISFLNIYIFMKKILKNFYLLNLGFLILIFVSYFHLQILNQDYFFQFFPIRVFFSSFIFLIVAYGLSFNKENKLYKYWGFIISSIGILWNFESGIIIFLSFLFYLFFIDAYVKSTRIKIINFYKSFLGGLLIVTMVFILYSIFIYYRSGFFPNFSNLYSSHKIFSLGYYSLPMPAFHPWNILVLIYITSLSYCFYNLKKKYSILFTSKLFFLTIFGIGLFSYYVGRSHDYNLLLISYPGIIIALIFLDKKLKEIKNSVNFNIKINTFVSLTVYIFIFFYLNFIFNIPNFYELAVNRNSWFNNKIDDNLNNKIQCIKAVTYPGEEILILSKNQAVLHNYTNTKSVFNPGLSDLFYKSDYNRLINMINANQDLKIFVENNFAPKTFEQKYIFEILNLVKVKFKNIDFDCKKEYLLFFKN